MNQYIVYAAGKMGVTIKRYAEELGLHIAGFYDNSRSLQGTLTDGKKVFTKEEVRCILDQGGAAGFIIGSEVHLEELLSEITAQYGDSTEIIKPDDIQKRYWQEIVPGQRRQLKERYEVDYESQVAVWADNLMSEVEYWVKQNASPKGTCHDGYVRRYRHQGELFACSRLKKALKPGDIVLDAGCGICTQYGNRLSDGRLHLTAVDPLAYFYNAINRKSMGCTEPKVRFGLFEFLSVFCGKNSADAVLVDNALDHCIDPLKSVIECLNTLKTGGVLSMMHRRCEAVYEGYEGLHKWNVDVSEENEFLIWNQSNMVNVSRAVRDFARVDVRPVQKGTRRHEAVEINMEKLQDFDTGRFWSREQEFAGMGSVTEAVMKLLSDEKNNRQFARLLEEI